MAITAAGVRQQRQLTAIIYEAFRRSTWVNVGNRSWESQMAGAHILQFLSLGDEGSVQDRTYTQLDGEVTYTTSAATKLDMTRMWFNAYDQVSISDMRTLATAGRLESYMAARLGRKVSQHIDGKIASYVAGLTYDTVDGSGNDNRLSYGTASSVFLTRAFPSAPSGTNAADIFVSGIKDAHMLLKEKNAIDGEYEGDGGSSQLAFVCPVAVARMIADYLESKGSLVNRGDIAGQALVNRGIVGTSAYMGTAFGYADIVGTTSLARPTGTNDWNSYVVPTNGNLAVAVTPTDLDTAEFGQGNTKGAYVHRRTIVGSWGALALRPEHIVRVTILAD